MQACGRAPRASRLLEDIDCSRRDEQNGQDDHGGARPRARARPEATAGAGVLRAARLLSRGRRGAGTHSGPAAHPRDVSRPGRERPAAADHPRLRDAAQPPPPAAGRAHERAPPLQRRFVRHAGSQRDVLGTRHHLSGPMSATAPTPAILHLSLVTSGELTDAVGRRLGRVEDLVARLHEGDYPPISGAVAKVAGRLVFVPAEQIGEVEHGRITLAKTRLDLQPFERREGELLLREDLLDRQLINVDGARLVRANEIEIARIEGWWRVVGIDIHPRSLLRRLLPRAVAPGAVGVSDFLDWASVEPFTGHIPTIQLRVPHPKLARLHPAELADLVEATPHGQGKRSSPPSTTTRSSRPTCSRNSATSISSSSPKTATTTRSPTSWLGWKPTTPPTCSRSSTRSAVATSSATFRTYSSGGCVPCSATSRSRPAASSSRSCSSSTSSRRRLRPRGRTAPTSSSSSRGAESATERSTPCC